MYKILFLVAFFLLGCSTTSTLTLKDGTLYEGKVTRKNDRTFRVKTEHGPEHIVEAVNIQDIDHPGNVHFWIGTGVISMGIASSVYAGVFLFSDDDLASALGSLFLIPSIITLVVGAQMTSWGSKTWLSAKNKANKQTLTMQPTVFDKEGLSPGLNVKLRF